MPTSLSSVTFLTDLTNYFRDQCLAGMQNLTPEANFLIYVFGVFEICMMWGAFFGDVDPKDYIIKILKIGAFVFIVANWKEISIDVFFESFKTAGLTASNTTTAADPSSVLNKGIFLTKDVLDAIIETSGWQTVLGTLSTWIVKLLFCIVVMCGFGWMAMQLVLLNIEYYIFAALSIILIPFGMIKYTTFLFQGVIRAVFAFGIKIMVITFIFGIGIKIFNGWTTSISAESKIEELVQASFGAMIYAFLVWKIPNIASSIISGMPSLDAGDAVRGAQAIGGVTGAATSTVLRGAGATSAAANAANGSNLAVRGMNFGKNLGIAGYEAAKHAAFGKNFIASRNNAASRIARHNNKAESGKSEQSSPTSSSEKPIVPLHVPPE